MERDIIESLRQLVCGEIEAGEWIQWWTLNVDRVKPNVKPGQFLRLKPGKQGSFGPPTRCVLTSQQEAAKLLEAEGVPFELSNRYQTEWESEFRTMQEEARATSLELRRIAEPILKSLESNFPEPGASKNEISELQSELGIPLPEGYRVLLASTRNMELGDVLKIGLQHTTLLEITMPSLPARDFLCLGDCWIEADGDQLLLDMSDGGEAVIYYSHSVPELRTIGNGFRSWIEGIPSWDTWT